MSHKKPSDTTLVKRVPRLKPGRIKEAERETRASLALAKFRGTLPGTSSNNYVCALVCSYMSSTDKRYEILLQNWRALSNSSKKLQGAFDHLLEESGISVEEFIAQGRVILTQQSENAARSIIAAKLPELAVGALKLAQSGTPEGAQMMKWLLQRHGILNPPPGTQINTTVNAAVQVNTESASPAPFMEKYADELRRQRQLPPPVIDVTPEKPNE